MCGVVGLLIRNRDLEPALGALLAPMIEALAERGPDSSGIAVYREGPAVERFSLGSDDDLDWPAMRSELEAVLAPPAVVVAFPHGALVELPIGGGGSDERALRAYLAERRPAVRVLGAGRHVAVVKSTGDPRRTCRELGLAGWAGYLAVAHTRMATESAVTLLHSHPFVPAADLCVVHNGSFSNYASVRRALQRRGTSFDSDNDSEVAARLLAERLGRGDDLEEATRWLTKEMDGFFTLVITTAGAMSVVRDAFACKPAVVAETPEYVAVASEYRALAHLPGIAGARIFEPRPEEVYTWTR